MKPTDERKGGHGRHDRDDTSPRQEREDNWEEQQGYGERVLDRDQGPRAAEEEVEGSEQADPHGGSR